MMFNEFLINLLIGEEVKWNFGHLNAKLLLLIWTAASDLKLNHSNNKCK